MVEISHEACDALATLLRAKSIPMDHEESSLPGLPNEEVGNFYLALVAICHQTSPRNGAPLHGTVGGVLLRGWDYLSAKLEEAAREDHQLLSPTRWATMSGSLVSQIFKDPAAGALLTDAEGRAALLRDLGRGMIERGWRSANDMFLACERQIASGPQPLITALSRFQAYRDLVRKKTFFYLALMRNSGIWEYRDPENLGPPVDYHEVRGHLRLGTVVVHDAELRRKLTDARPVTPEEDIAIRSATARVIMRLTTRLGMDSPSQLHYLFWNVFRACCTRVAPHCHECPPSCSLPPRYVVALGESTEMRRCPLAPVCRSVDADVKLLEHVFETDFY